MTLISVLVLLILTINYFFYRYIRKFNRYLYVIVLITSIISMFFETNIINMGYVGLSFFLVVMFMTIMEKGEFKKRLLGNRAEFAIIGSMFAMTHGLKFILYAIDYQFLWEAPINFYFGVAAIIILAPLFLTSFLEIRKKMKGKNWKKLHKLSYLFYILVGIHLVLINNERMLYYIVIFALYILLRVFTPYQVKHQPIKKAILH